MEKIKNDLWAKVSSVTPKFLMQWDITLSIGKTIGDHAPLLSDILCTAAQTEHANKENTTKDCTIVGT